MSQKTNTYNLSCRLLDSQSMLDNMFDGCESIARSCDVFCNRGFTYGLFDGEKCWGFIGVVPLWQGVADVWGILDAKSFKYPLYLRRQSMNMIDEATKKYQLHRLQSSSSIFDYHHASWMEWLGFEMECISKQYTSDKQDFARYALTIKDDLCHS